MNGLNKNTYEMKTIEEYIIQITEKLIVLDIHDILLSGEGVDKVTSELSSKNYKLLKPEDKHYMEGATTYQIGSVYFHFQIPPKNP